MRHQSVRPWLAGLVVLAIAASAPGQGVDLENRPVVEVRVEGLKQVNLQLVLNQVRLKKGDPYDKAIVERDIRRITLLGRFASVKARAEVAPGGGVNVIYEVKEQPLLSDVQVVGNKDNALNDQALLNLIVLRAGDPIDPFLVDRGVREIKSAYEKAGYFLSDVTVDQKLLDESGILFFRVRDGHLVKIRQIKFSGNESFTAKQLQAQIRSRTAIFIFRKGELNREQLDADAANLRKFYRDRGYLDAQVGVKDPALSPNNKEAIIEFVIDEGRQYTVAQIGIKGNDLFSTAQLLDTIPLKVGDVYSFDKQTKSQQAITSRYGKLGFLETKVQIDRLFHERQPQVDLLVTIDEGIAATVGRVTVRGNQLTKDKVILRQSRGMDPGRRFDRDGIALTERRLSESSLFSEANVTVLGDPQDTTRDALIEVKEKNTGSLSFGAGISSDAGVIGAIDLIQRNFDIADVPDSVGEMFTGKAFRGAGQYFAIALQPGNEFSRYSVTFREPYLLESPYLFETSFRYYNRLREDWEEQRLGGTVSLGQRFGDVWSANVVLRADQVDIQNIQIDAARDVFAVQGKSLLTSVGIGVTRATTDSRIFPTRGSKASISVSRTGTMGGDYNFTRLGASYYKFWTVDEDFFGRRTVLSLRGEMGFIFEDHEAPIFERFYAGGHRSFRGFQYRGVGPRGIINGGARAGQVGNDPVGADWLFLVGLEYNWPIFQDILRGVVFIDTGTVQKQVGLDEYRVSIGGGIRLRIPFLGQAPFALDVALPIVKQDGDEEQYFSFDLAIPF